MEDGMPAPKRRKGGIQQRRAADLEERTGKSALHELLMTYLAQGILSASMCWNISQAAAEDLKRAGDGIVFPDLEFLASFTSAKNVQRGIDGLLAKQSDWPMPTEVNIPMQGTNPEKASSYIMLPHETFHAMYHSAKGWTSSILPDSSKLASFWSTFCKHPAMVDHTTSKRSDKHKAVPFCLHGDEVPIVGVGKIWCRSALCFSMSSLMATAAGRSAAETNLYVWGVFEKYVLPTEGVVRGTMDTFWMVMKWSFEILMSGRWPSKNWKGEKIHGFLDCLEGTDLEKLRLIQHYIYHFQKDMNSRYRFKQKLLKMTMIKPRKGFPRLRGRAADIHSLAGAISSLFARFMDETNANHGRINLVLKLNVELQQLLEEFSPRFGFTALPDSKAKRAYNIGLEMASVHVHLQSLYEAEGRRIFNITSKTHFVLHSLHLSAFIHPHMVWCYNGETTMHRLQTLWKSCLPGVKHWQVAKKAALKERHLLWLRCKA
ncbi:hypothetical protein AK812_SmicGene4402 [Symbiodinium microadriaticum]|uniref:Uncharacterized protein n=1 Tax=Symbiodinium microadriaticum TaxID=2951 RepID=A0A1Q9EWH5_SYMMI|nr:hypothetical protein AK812_SmicGene4402 [Symbiodinium microadriaticum]